MANYLQRYLQGECVSVWNELVSLGNQVREERFYSDAWAVAQETMRRVNYNFELVIPRLRALGYVFIHDRHSSVRSLSMQELQWIRSNPSLHTEPSLDIVDKLDLFEREVGMLPLSLRAFYERVGGLNFIGWYRQEISQVTTVIHKPEPHLLFEEFDPVFVYPFNRELVEQGDDWQYFDTPADDWMSITTENSSVPEKEYSNIVIAPDVYHKMNVSGGTPYEIRIPSKAADAQLLGESHNINFVEYLRLCCHYAGLPGLEKVPSSLSKKINDLCLGMLPI